MQLDRGLTGYCLRGWKGCGIESETMASGCFATRRKSLLESFEMKQWLVALAFVTVVSVSYTVVAYAGCVGGVCR